MAVIRDEAEKMGVPGKHWLRVVTQTLKSGGGKVKVVDVKGDYADIVANHPLGHVMGPVKVPTRALRTSVDKMKAKVFKAPEKVENPGGWPSVFLAGAIDMGEAEDWQKEVTDTLADVECVILNPRRSDWDSSWEQSIENPKFKEQVEWELKGLEDANFVAMGLTKDSKAPISLLELGLHVVGRRMIVYCPEGFYRKGNIDVVCKRYGVPVYEDFEEFCQIVKARMLETIAGTHNEHVLPAGTLRQQKQYYITAADRLTAREFVLARYRVAKTAVYRPIQMVKPWTDASGNPVEPDKMQMQPLRRRPDYGEIEMEIEKRMKESSMNKTAVANELVKIAKSLVASDSLIDLALDQRELSNLSGYIDDQTYDLLVEVYQKLQRDFALSGGQREAINRLIQSKEAQTRWPPDLHRNNIFKAAHALGIHLPSSMF